MPAIAVEVDVLIVVTQVAFAFALARHCADLGRAPLKTIQHEVVHGLGLCYGHKAAMFDLTNNTLMLMPMRGEPRGASMRAV